MTALADRIQALRTAGAAAYDGPALRFIEALLQRAAGLDGSVAERLEARAAERLAAFHTSMQAARTRAREALDTLDAADADVDGVLRSAFESGDFKRVIREAPAAVRRAEARDPHARLDRLTARAESEGVQLPAAEQSDPARAGDQISHALFRHTADHLRSTVTVARAADRVPAEFGPYNPDALAARTLATIEALSPDYLRAVLAQLDDLSALTALRLK
jgi:hypothetical protein